MPCFDDGHLSIGSRRCGNERERAVAAAYDAQVGRATGFGRRRAGRGGRRRVASEGQTAPGEDHLPAGPVAVQDGQPGVLEQEVRQADGRADAEPDRDEPGGAAGDLELEARIGRAAVRATIALIGSKRMPPIRPPTSPPIRPLRIRFGDSVNRPSARPTKRAGRHPSDRPEPPRASHRRPSPAVEKVW